jgi:hypothetical protein
MESSMDTKVSLDSIYAPSEDVVVRLIEGELIIVPLVSGIGDFEDELFTLNETGKAIWDHLDGKKTLREVVNILSREYVDPAGEIETDVLGLLEELQRRSMVVGVGKIDE